MSAHAHREQIMTHHAHSGDSGRTGRQRAFAALGAAAVAIATLATAACDDPTVVEDHFPMHGFAIFMGAQEIYRYTLDDTVVDTLVVPQGSHDLIFIPVDSEGEYMMEEEGAHEEGEEEHELEITSDNTAIVSWTPEAHTDDSAHDWIEFHGRLQALQVGTTHLQVCVPHDVHCDFEVPEPGMPVTVTAP
jgi:hypothetical protein